MTTSYLHPKHLKDCLQPGDFIFCTPEVRDSLLNPDLKYRIYANPNMPEAHASADKVMVVAGLPDGSVDHEAVLEAAIELQLAGHPAIALFVLQQTDKVASIKERETAR